MKRHQLFEIQDQSWCPVAIRDGVTDLLVMNLKIVPLYEPVIPKILELAKLSDGKWIDLCAGAGGGCLLLKHKMPAQIKELILTDLYPHAELTLPEGARYFSEPVDASNVPRTLQGFRTLFTSFHHLPDPVAFNVLKNARDTKTPIGVFEFTNRSFFCLLMVMPSFFFSFLLVPFILPWKMSRFFWTYIIPAIPVVVFIDIVMSCFRTRNVAELNKMTEDLRTDDYVWEAGTIPSYLGMKITYLTGKPRHN